MATEEYSIGYQDGYQAGFNEVIAQPRKPLKDELEGQLLADKTYLRGMKAGYNLAMMHDGENFNAAIAAYDKQIMEAIHVIKENT